MYFFFPKSYVIAIAIALLASTVAGFGINPVFKKPIRTSKVVVFGIRCENKYYQLEEREDKESCTTELFLLEDGGIAFGETDGPLWTEAVGQWEVEPGTDNFKMDFVRTYGGGAAGSDMGEFSYEIARSFVGTMAYIGASVGVDGVIHSKITLDDDDQEVGFFSMIDGTDDRIDGRSDANNGQSATAAKPPTPEPAPPAAQDWPQPSAAPAPATPDWSQFGQAQPAPAPAAPDWSQYGQQAQPAPVSATPDWPQYGQQAQPAPAPATPDWSQFGQQAQPVPAPAPAAPDWSQYGQQAQAAPAPASQGWAPYGQGTPPAQESQTTQQGWAQQYGQDTSPQQQTDWPQHGQAPPAPAPPSTPPDWPKYGY